jgi:hypothetical protein
VTTLQRSSANAVEARARRREGAKNCMVVFGSIVITDYRNELECLKIDLMVSRLGIEAIFISER